MFCIVAGDGVGAGVGGGVGVGVGVGAGAGVGAGLGVGEGLGLGEGIDATVQFRLSHLRRTSAQPLGLTSAVPLHETPRSDRAEYVTVPAVIDVTTRVSATSVHDVGASGSRNRRRIPIERPFAKTSIEDQPWLALVEIANRPDAIVDTFTCARPVMPWYVACRSATPSPMPVVMPDEDTVATAVFDDRHVDSPLTFSLDPEASVAVAVYWAAVPTSGGAPVTLTPVTDATDGVGDAGPLGDGGVG
jgi:hypothetical protein